MKIAIIGFGSIGKLHLDILKKKQRINQILVITNRNIENTPRIKYNKSIEKIINFDPEYIIICSPTSKHYSNFIFIEKKS